MYKKDLTLNNLQGLICHKTLANKQTILIHHVLNHIIKKSQLLAYIRNWLIEVSPAAKHFSTKVIFLTRPLLYLAVFGSLKKIF